MSNLSKESIRRLRQVKRAILAQPEFYDQSNPPNYAYIHGGCNTPCCLAGWAIWLDSADEETYKKRVLGGDVFVEMASSLRITEEQSHLLFRTGYFHGCQYTPIETVRDAAARVEHFIATDGRE